MSDNASGVAKRVAYKEETTWGTAAGASGAQYLRRVSSSLGLDRQKYESNEIRRSYQRSDVRAGLRSVGGSISGELSAGTYKDLMAAAVRKAFTAVSAITGLSITVAASGSDYTVTRSTGSFITDGIKLGQVVRLTAGSFDAANLNKNLFVIGLTATVATVRVLNGTSMTAEGPISSATLSVPGKVAYVPQTSHTDKSFTIEHYFADITQSEYFTGCKVNEMNVQLPPSGLATVEFGMMGKDVVTGSSQYFSSPTAETSTGSLAAVNGLMAVQGSIVALLTGLNFSLKGNMSGEPVVGSNTYASISEGRVTVDGQVTALFTDATLRDYALNETEVSLSVVMTASGAAAADFIAFTMPRVKFNSAKPDDGEKSLVLSMPFDALENTAGGSGTNSEATTLAVQDSQA